MGVSTQKAKAILKAIKDGVITKDTLQERLRLHDEEFESLIVYLMQEGEVYKPNVEHYVLISEQ